MLSRSAQGLYWMGRYLERAEHLCRLLHLQTEALVDRTPREIYFGWSRIYGSLSRQPPGDTLEVGDDSFTLADSYTLADDLTFESSNTDSVWSCFALGRENARQMRHCISAEMWIRLNLAYLRIQKLSIQDIWGSPESFYEETVAEIATFAGVAAATMYRDQGLELPPAWPLQRARVALDLAAAHPACLRLYRLYERGRVGGGLDEPAARVSCLRGVRSQLQRRGAAAACAGPAGDGSDAARLAVPLPRHGGGGARRSRPRPGRGRQRRRRAPFRTHGRPGALRLAGPGGP